MMRGIVAFACGIVLFGLANDNVRAASDNAKSKCLFRTTQFSCPPSGENVQKENFLAVWPSIRQDIDEIICNKTTVTTENTTAATETKSSELMLWICSLGSTTVINVVSLVVAYIMPNKDKRYYPYVMTFLISLGISVLLCNSMFYLLPHAMGLHQSYATNDNLTRVQILLSWDSYLWRCVTIILGIFSFFIFQIILSVINGDHRKLKVPSTRAAKNYSETKSFWDVHNRPTPTASGIAHKSYHTPGNSDAMSYKVRRSKRNSPQHFASFESIEEDSKEGEASVTHNVSHGPSVQNSAENMTDHYTVEEVAASLSSHKAKIGTIIANLLRPDVRKLQSIVFMVTIGDTLHNFLDGATMSVSFSKGFHHGNGLLEGISTTMAILLHEIPHELVDFAVLKASGLSTKYAILLNFLSSLAAYVGVVLGLVVSSMWDDAVSWCFAVTAGLFIYLALVKMLPQLLKQPMLAESPVVVIFIEVMGLMMGMVLMFLLVLYEHDPMVLFVNSLLFSFACLSVGMVGCLAFYIFF